MSFTSLSFLAFFGATLAGYYLLPKKLQKYVLLAASVFFFMTFGKRAFAVCFATSLVTWAGCRLMEARQSGKLRKVLLWILVLLNIGSLIGLKYLPDVRTVLHLVVPIGISFYTLAVTGYVVDVYRGKYPAEKNYLSFLLFVIFFPHILQGPIPRYDALSSQLKGGVKFDYRKVTFGAQLMLWGYIKKLVIADRAAVFVDQAYGNVYATRGAVLLAASLLYTIQIYMDFSGCVDIAMGAAEMLGIRLTPNFRQPYFADSINDFWRRWHKSLSSWFRDYVYIPLGGNRKGTARRWINVLIVFLTSGFWHGVGANYVIWGLIHGLYQIIGAGLKPLRQKLAKLLGMDPGRFSFRLEKIVFTFFLVNLAWIFFRLTDLTQALYTVKTIFTDFSPWLLLNDTMNQYGITAKQWQVLWIFLGIALFADLMNERGIVLREKIASQHLLIRWGIYLLGVAAVLLFGVYGIGYDAAGFIYMQF